MLLHGVVNVGDLDADESARDEEWYDVLRLAYDFTDLTTDFFALNHELFLATDEFLLRDGSEVLEFLELLG